MSVKLEQLIVEASSDPLNPINNFNIALEYDSIGQTAAAVGFYLRVVEYGSGSKSHELIVYTSLLRIALCMDKQKDRNHSSKNSLLQAIAYLPWRPEAYFLLSRLYEREQKWQECYTTATIGRVTTFVRDQLPADVEYPGVYGFLFESAVSGWWIGRAEESKQLFLELLDDPTVDAMHKHASRMNLSQI